MAILAKAIGWLPPSWVRSVSVARHRFPWLKPILERVAGRVRGRDGTIRRGVGAGLRFNPGPANAGYLLGDSEADVQHALAGLITPGMTVFDVGANVGFLTVLAARLVGPSGRVVGFEPLPLNADCIEHNARLNGFDHVAVRREALGSADGRARFLMAPETTRGMLDTSGFAKAENRASGEIDVPVRSLDSLWAEGAIPRPDLIKLDIEGVEADVLRGAVGLIRATRPVLMIELHDTAAAVAAVLEEFGYRAAVLGDDRPMTQAHWNAHVIAAPADRPEPLAIAREPAGSTA